MTDPTRPPDMPGTRLMQLSDLNEWVATFAYAVDTGTTTDTQAVAGVNDGDDDVLVTSITTEAVSALLANLDQLLSADRDVAAFATKVAWSPTPDGASSPAWSMVVVGRGLPAWFGVRRIVEDTSWWALKPADVPWFMLSTASGLRAAVEHHQPLVMKDTGDPALMKTPSQVPHPDVDERGLL